MILKGSSLIKSLTSEGTNVIDFNPLTKIKKVIAVIAKPQKKAPKYLYLLSIWNVNNKRETYCTKEPKANDNPTDSKIL